MKRLLYTILSTVALLILCSCSYTTQKLDEGQVKNICHLATVECYVNNMAMVDIPKGEGITHLFEKDRQYWIEYDGVVSIGIDMNEVTVSVSKDKVTITLPHAGILSTDFEYESLENHRIVTNDDSWINKNIITKEAQKKALEDAQAKMIDVISENKSLITRAEDRAKILIENYINDIGELSGIEYKIKWKFKE